jgi:hypothetical protein
MVTRFGSPGVPPGVVQTVVVVPDPQTIRGDGVVESTKKALISLAIPGCSIKQAKGKSTSFPFSDMGQSRRWFTFWDDDILSVGQGPVVVAGPQFLEGLSGFVCQEVEVGHTVRH